MPGRQILSQAERESLLLLAGDELTLTRMVHFSEQNLTLINAHRKLASTLPDSLRAHLTIGREMDESPATRDVLKGT